MGQKVNFNKKKSKLKIIGIIVLSILIIALIISSLKRAIDSIQKENDVQNKSEIAGYDVNSYTSLKELLNSYNCKLLSDENNVIKVSFSVNLYDGETSNEKYFTNICKVVASYKKYEDFELIDNSRKIDIEVKCVDNDSIAEIKINDDVNYYLNHDSEINSKKRNTKITEFSIQSPELQALIDANWEENRLSFGEKTSTCDGYNIFFEEGIKYKIVNRKIFNIIFTNKYTGQIAGTLTTSSRKGDVESALGKPTFEENSIYGYLGKDNYIFFNFSNQEVSVYPVVKVNSNDAEKIKKLIEEMNKTNDVKQFSVDLLSMWTDFDVYDFSSDYVDLRYTLKGVKLDISNTSLKNGIFIYSNFSGDIDVNKLDNVYFEGEDLVFSNEKDRVLNNSTKRSIQGSFSDEELKELGIKFSVIFERFDKNISIGPKFYSRDREYPDSELENTLEVSSWKWYDEYNFIYSVNEDGIYVYNCINRTNEKLADISDESIIINEIRENKIIYNDDKEILIDVN